GLPLVGGGLLLLPLGRLALVVVAGDALAGSRDLILREERSRQQQRPEKADGGSSRKREPREGRAEHGSPHISPERPESVKGRVRSPALLCAESQVFDLVLTGRRPGVVGL